MQNWRDSIQAIAAGYRDRIVHISLRSNEGGLNLSMPPDLLKLLSDRGRKAGELLRDQFDFPSHIWARYRLTMCAIEKYLDVLQNSWDDPLPQDEQGWAYIKGDVEAPHYRGTKSLEDRLRNALEDLIKLNQEWRIEQQDGKTLCAGAPRPEPVLRSQPKF